MSRPQPPPPPSQASQPPRERPAPPLQPALAATYLATVVEARDASGQAWTLAPAATGAPLAWPWTGTLHVITAWNPYSDLLPHDENEAAQVRLVAEVAARGLRAHPAVGRDPAAGGHGWAEPSLLVEGLTAGQAVALGRAFEQHAVFEVDSAAGQLRLLACRDGAVLGRRPVRAQRRDAP